MSDPELVDEVRNVFANNVASVAFTSLLLYDIVLTMGDEVQYMWWQKWTFGKILYMLNRYIPPIDLTILMNSYMNPGLRHNFCLPWFKIDNCLLIVSLCAIDMIFLLRTWAVWQRKGWVLCLLLVTYVACMLGAAGSLTYTTVVVTSSPFPSEIRPCSSDVPITKVLYGLYASVMIFDTLVLILTAARAVPQVRLYGLSPLWRALYQDGFFYYGVIFLASVANLIVLAAAPPELAFVMITLHRAMFSAMGSRLVLNLQGVVTKRVNFVDYGEPGASVGLNFVGNGVSVAPTELSTFKTTVSNGEPVLAEVSGRWNVDYQHMDEVYDGSGRHKVAGMAM